MVLSLTCGPVVIPSSDFNYGVSTTGKVRENLEKSGNSKSMEKSGKLENVSGKLDIHVIAKFTHRNYRSPLL